MSKFTRFVVLSLSFGLAIGIPVATLTPIVKAQMSTTEPSPSTASPSPTNGYKPTSRKMKHKKHRPAASATTSPGAPTTTSTSTP